MSMSSLVAAALAFAFTQLASTPIQDPRVDNCRIEADRNVPLPAEEAGVVVGFLVEEGARVEEGDVLVRIDDRVAQAQVAIAEANKAAAVARAENDIDLEYSKKAAAVAKTDYDVVRESNQDFAGAVSETEVRQKKLMWQRSVLAIKKAQMDRTLAGLDAKAKQEELAAAILAVGRREITAPFAGEVVRVHREDGEWVTAGDQVLRLMRFDVLRVYGRVKADQYLPHEVHNCEVEVIVDLARGEQVSVPGRITHVSSLVDGALGFQVRADIANRKFKGHWLVRPGLPATMTIRLGTGGKPAPGEKRLGQKR